MKNGLRLLLLTIFLIGSYPGAMHVSALGAPRIVDIRPSSPQPVGICITVVAEATSSSDFGMMRVRFGNEPWQEVQLPEIKRVFCTNKYQPGIYKIRVEVAELGDNNWSRPTIAEADYELKDLSYFYPGQVAIFGTLRQVFPAHIGQELYIIRVRENQRWLVPNRETAEAICLGWDKQPGNRNVWDIPESELLKVPQGPDVPDINTDPDAFWEFRNKYFLPCDPSSLLQKPKDIPNSLIAYVGTDSIGNAIDVRVVNSDGSDMRVLPLATTVPGTYRATCWPSPTFSPNGKYLAFARSTLNLSSEELVIINVETGEEVNNFSNFGKSYDWSPDSSQIIHGRDIGWDATGNPQGDGLWTTDILSGQDRLLIPPNSGLPLANPKWSPDGSHVAFHEVVYGEGFGPFGTAASSGSDYEIWDRQVGSFDWSPDGKEIVFDNVLYSHEDPGLGLFIADFLGTNERVLVGSDPFIAVDPHWSPDGQYIAFINTKSWPYSLWMIRPDGSELRRLSDASLGTINSVSWSPDSQHVVASSDKGINVISLIGGTPVFIGNGHCPDWQTESEPSESSFSTISGNAGTGDVTLSYVDGGEKSVLAESSGHYSITVPYGWSGIVTPSKPGFIFDPVSRTYDNVQSDQVNQNFTAIQFPSPEIELTGLEVTQGIQNLRNDMVLIKHKRTFVRAHVRSATGMINNVTAMLIGRRSDGSTVFQLHPSNIGKHIHVKESPSRLLPNDSFYFELPLEELSGNLDLEFQGVGYTPDCNEPDSDSDPNNEHDCTVNVTFSNSPALEMKFIDFMWLGADGSVHVPSRNDHNMVEHEIETVLPIPDLKPEFGKPPVLVDFPGPPNTDLDFTLLLARLAMIRMLDGCSNFGPVNCTRFYIGILVDPPNGGTLGSAGHSEPSKSKYNYIAAAYYIPTHERLGPSHELGHTLGRCHTDNANNPWTPADICFHDPTDGTISREKDENNPDSYYGFDTYAIDFFDKPYVDKPYRIGPVYKPDAPDLMSYAPYQWPSDYTYREFSQYIKNYLVSNSGVSLASLRLPSGGPTILVSGVVNSTAEAGELDSLYVVEAPVFASIPDSGSYTIRFEDSSGQKLASYGFEPDFVSASYIDNDEPSHGGTGYFVVPLPWNPDTARIVLLHDRQELDSRMASSNAPTISIDYPNGGESLSGSTTTLSWSSTDLDGANLDYVVQYSTDAGATWETLATDWTSTTYELNLDMIAGTNQGLLRVLASDGFNTAQDQSDATFSVAKHAPWTRIDAPVTGSLFVSDQTIILKGSAFDNEDGYLEDEALSWASNIDGVLGTGQSLAIIASKLTEGIHTIILNAQDSDGQTGSSPITIIVYRDRPTLPTNLSTAPSALNFLALKEGKQTTGEVISVRNDGDGSMTWSVTANQSWILLGTEEGIAPTDFIVTADPAGLSVGEHTGIITIIASDALNSPQTISVTLQVQEEQKSEMTWILYGILILTALMLIILGVALFRYRQGEKVSSVTRSKELNEHVEKYCINCGTRLPKEGSFCPKCGTPRGGTQ